MIRCLLLLLLVLAAPARAQAPDALAETSVGTEDPILVGQRVPIYVKLLTTTTFAGAPVFDLPSLPGALLMEVQDRPLLGSETDHGTSYVSQTHELALFPQQAGTLTLPAFTVRFASSGADGGAAEDHRLQTEPITVTAALPEGAKGPGPFVVSGGVELTEQWQPQVEELKPGDAVTHTVMLQAQDVPAMLLPSLVRNAIAGLRAYPRPPQLIDQQERGAFTGRRTEQVTYVAETPGSATVPPIRMPWWHADTGDAETAELPGRTIKIVAGVPTAAAPTSPRTAPARSSGWPAIVVAGVLVLAVLGLAIRRWWRETPEDSEAAAFAKLEEALRAGDAQRSEAALFVWLDHLPDLPKPATVAAVTARTHDPDLVPELDRLLQAAQNHRPWNGVALGRHLHEARQWFSRTSGGTHRLMLGPLNPS